MSNMLAGVVVLKLPSRPNATFQADCFLAAVGAHDSVLPLPSS